MVYPQGVRTFPLLLGVVAALTLAGCSGSGNGSESSSSGKAPIDSSGNKPVKIGFLVKSATEPWFQTEWRFADEEAKKLGCEILKAEVKDADKVVSELDSLKVKGAQGVIICSPDQKLGPTIVEKAEQNGLKLITVDDRLVGADDKPMTNVHHLGIDAKNIGKAVGEGLLAEMKKRGWKPEEVGLIALTIDTLDTAKDRIGGAVEALTAAGFPSANIYRSPWKEPFVIETAQDAANIVLTQHPDKKFWLAIASNDDGVLGAVRATEGRQIAAANVIGIGINGTSGVDDLKKSQPTGFFGSILLSPRQHGASTVDMMYEWITKSAEPKMETWTTGTLITRDNFREEMKKEGLEVD